jgi:phosphoribosyl 1,2-cyclic phosphodiesterase
VLDVVTLASSSAANATLIDDGAAPLLLDAGMRFSELQHAIRFASPGPAVAMNVLQLAGVLVTHEHRDHSRAVAELVRRGVDVYATAGTFGAMRERHHRARHIEAGERFELGHSWAAVAFETVHDAAEPVGFLLASSSGARVLYATDTAYIRPRFEGLTHILIECNNSLEIMRRRVRSGALELGQKSRVLRNHLSLERVLAFLEANDLEAVREIHLLHLSDGNSDAARFKTLVAGATGKPVYIANR